MNYLRRQEGIKKARKLGRVYKQINDGDNYFLNSNFKWFQCRVKTRKPCSCYRCGNKRKSLYLKHSKEALTMQEQKALIDAKEQLAGVA